MSVYLDSYIIEANLAGSTWTDITSDVIIEAISADWGITDNSAVDLVADAGSMTFTLNNIGDEYIPGHTSATAGWDINTPVRLKCTYEGVPYYFRFYVSELDVISEKFNRKKIRVSCVDYIELLARTPLTGQAAVASQTADQGITTLVAAMQTAPQATSYQTGKETFNTIFTATTPNTRIYGEVAKLVKSEFGYFYNKKDQTNGETLVFGNNQARSGLDTLDPIQLTDGSALLLETGDYLLLETGDKLLLNQTENAVFDNTMSSVDIQYGKDIVNYFKAIAYPTTVTAGAQTLWELGDPIEIGSGQTVTFRTNYRDPTGGNRTNCLTSEATGTTKSFRPNADGTGTNLDALLAVTATFGSEGVLFSLKNNHTATAYVITLTATGTGLLTYSPIFKEVESATSQASYDLRTQSIAQQYQQNPNLGISKGESIVEAEKNPRVDLQKISFNANRSTALMHSFLDLDVGNLVHIKEDDSEIDNYYYIQGKEFSIALGGIIDFSWVVRKTLSLSSGLSLLGVEFGDTTADAVDFGYVSSVTGLTTRSWSFWINLHADTAGRAYVIGMIAAFSADLGAGEWGNGYTISVINRLVEFYQSHTGASSADGIWRTAADTIPLNTWSHIAITHDISTSTNDPIIYIDGSAMALTETQTPVGDVSEEVGNNFVIGNNKSTTYNYSAAIDGQIKDVRIFNRVITSGEVTTLSGGGEVTSGMQFQTFCVRTGELSDYEDLTLTSDKKLIDNLYGVVGTPNGSPISRLIP